ncbi:MAG: ComF family protein [Kiloniellales bacterium]|nr:ComF family protein [Kiloniellales bacterium]
MKPSTAKLATGLVDLGSGLSAAALNAILPPRCIACGITVERPGNLCPDCWDGMDFLAPPWCTACGLPFEYDLGAEALCGDCSRALPPYARGRAVMAYDEASRRLLLRFKHSDRTDAAPAFAAWMARAGAALAEEAELIVPVPLHWTRLFRRRYNQAALLALALGRRCDKPVVTDLLLRRRATPSQGRLSRSARARNVAGAFAVKPARRARLRGRRVLLIDDVMTTGATLEACSRALLAGGAGAVDVLVLARVLRTSA